MQHPRVAGTATSFAAALGQLLPGDTSCFLETLPFLLWMRSGGNKKESLHCSLKSHSRKTGLLENDFHGCSACI